MTGTGKGRKGEKPTRDLRAEAAEDESDEEDERIFSNNYNDVCKFACNNCGDEVDSDKFKKHMTKIHSATCSMENLTQLCKDEEERLEREGWSVDDIILEEAERREAEKMTSGGQEVTQPELGTQVSILTCFLCQGAWTGDNKDDLQRHLEKDHKAIFKITELMELSVSKKTEEAGATGATEVTEVTGATGEDWGTS